MRATGREKSMVWGRRSRLRSEFLMEAPRLVRPEAFSMMDLHCG